MLFWTFLAKDSRILLYSDRNDPNQTLPLIHLSPRDHKHNWNEVISGLTSHQREIMG